MIPLRKRWDENSTGNVIKSYIDNWNSGILRGRTFLQFFPNGVVIVFWFKTYQRIWRKIKRSTFRFKVTVLLEIIFVHFSSFYFIWCIRKERKNLFYENVYCFIYVWARSLTRWKRKFNTIRVFRIRVKFYNIARLMHIRHDNWCVKWTKRIT